MEPDFTVHLIRMYHVPVVGSDGNIHNITRVSVKVGAQGPFTQDFGAGQDYQDTPNGINQWKSDLVVKIRAISGGAV